MMASCDYAAHCRVTPRVCARCDDGDGDAVSHAVYLLARGAPLRLGCVLAI